MEEQIVIYICKITKKIITLQKQAMRPPQN